MTFRGLRLTVSVIFMTYSCFSFLLISCFVKPGPALYYGVLLIVAVILLANFVIFAVVMQRLSCRESVHKTSTAEENENKQWRRVQRAVALSALLGLTWIFGFLAIGGAKDVFSVLFLIFNSLQGFFIFIMFCLRPEDIRNQWPSVDALSLRGTQTS